MEGDSPTVTFILENTSATTITAWDVRITVGAHSSGKGADGYRSFAGLTRAGQYIPPGGTLPVTARIPSGVASSSSPATITPRCAIFADKSVVGDEKCATFFFERRAAAMAAWQQLLAELRPVSTKGSASASSLQAVLARISAAPQNDGGDAIRQSVRANLSAVISRINSGERAKGPTFQDLVADAERNLAATQAHTR
jgi:hypothetical protein